MIEPRAARASADPSRAALPVTCSEWGRDLSFAREHDEMRREAGDVYFERRRERRRLRRRRRAAESAVGPAAGDGAEAAARDAAPDEG